MNDIRAWVSDGDIIENLENRIDALEAENKALRAAFRINMLRAFPNITHSDIDDLIARAILEKENNV